jgi:hypothetical protein
MKRICTLLLLAMLGHSVSAQEKTKVIYFPLDSFRLNQELVETIESAYQSINGGEKLVLRVLIHEEVKNKGLLNELDRKRGQELYDFFLAEGISKTSLKMTKVIGREAKGFISDEMKNLLIYDVEIYKTLPAVTFSVSDELGWAEDPAQSFSFNASEEQKITGTLGTQILIPAQAFEYKTGLTATDRITLELKEYLQPGAIASAGLIAMSNELPLQTGGFVWLKAVCDGKEVRLKKNKSITLRFPASGSLTDPELLCGQDIDGLITLNEQDPKITAKMTDPKYNELVSPHLHWLACAGKGKDDAKGTLSVKTGVSYNVAVRLILKDEREVMAAYYQPKLKDPVFMHLATGIKGTLVAYGKKDGKVYFYSKEITTATDAKEKLQMKESNPAAIKAFLLGLDK